MLSRMDEHDGFAGVEHIEQRVELGVAEETFAIARQYGDAISFHIVQRMNSLAACAFDIRQRQHGEGAEAIGPSALHVYGEVIASTRKVSGLGVIAEMHMWGRDRREGGLDAVVVHHPQ